MSLISLIFFGGDTMCTTLKAYVVKVELLISESHVSIKYHVVHVPGSMYGIYIICIIYILFQYKINNSGKYAIVTWIL